MSGEGGVVQQGNVERLIATLRDHFGERLSQGAAVRDSDASAATVSSNLPLEA